jgi:glycine oxidase
MVSPPSSLIIVGGGIVGLTLAAAAQARGDVVTIIARDAAEDTASGVAAGMIAPALEALNDPDPALTYHRLYAAQQAWLEDFAMWPEPVQTLLADAHSRTSLYVIDRPHADAPKLRTIGAAFSPLDWDDMRIRGFDPEGQSVFAVPGDWLVEAMPLLAALRAALVTGDATFIDGAVERVAAGQVALENGTLLTADAVVVAAGYGARRFSDTVPSLAALQPIKGHLLDIGGSGLEGVVRSEAGYFAGYGRRAKFGASMQPGRDDLGVESEVVEDLKARADFLPSGAGRVDAVPRVGIRASTPDGWPLIGRDAASGVWVATGMRRNGFVFAPFAARLILAQMRGEGVSEDASAYDPNRF